jgi:ribonuclease D
MPQVHWVGDQGEFSRVVATLEKAPQLALDTEFLRERTYFPRLCLLQIAVEQETWLIDTIAIGDLAPLAPILVRGDVRKIVHAGRQDLEVLQLASGVAPTRVWDTQIASALLQPRPQVAYADLIDSMLGIKLDKGQTRTDWSRRPLSEAQRRYAVDDVRYLAPLAGELEQRLADRGRTEWALEDCAALAQLPTLEAATVDAWRRLSGIAQLAPRPRAIAKALALWRERTAIALDRPRSWVLADAAIYALAARGELDREILRQHASAHLALAAATVASLGECLAEAAQVPLVDTSPALEARPSPEDRRLQKSLGALVDRRAAALGIAPEVLATRGDLRSLVQGERDVAVLRGWRRREIGEELLAALVLSGDGAEPGGGAASV